MTPQEIAQMIDHTLLKPEATVEQIKTLCEEAKEYNFKTVCVNPCYVANCYDLLSDSEVGVCTVIGFPLGANTPETKAFETKHAINDGASEIDMVINIGALKYGNDELVLSDIMTVVDAAKETPVKVILETCLLTDEEIIKACKLCVQARASFVKTSTGFSKDGANPRVVKLMRDTVGTKMGVKASGGVRSLEDAKAMIEAGANRLGASSGVAIVNGLKADSSY